MERTYKNAVEFLNSRRRGPLLRQRGHTDNVSRLPHLPALNNTPSIQGMRTWLRRLGHRDDDINSLKVTHVAGTKGKGSTCAFVESFLRAHGARTGFPQRTGLYTSPHLIDITERIRIDFAPLSHDAFAKYVFKIRDGLRLRLQPNRSRPRYLQLLALVSFHAFLQEKVDVAIYETHSGGEYCATNVIQQPIVTGLTRIGMDHVHSLGPTIENIAWHKAGIFKTGSPALSQIQEHAVARVLQQRALAKGIDLQFIDMCNDLRASLPVEQRSNASLAVALANTFLSRTEPDPSRAFLTRNDIQQGVKQFSWPARYQTIRVNNCLWCLDGAHNEFSIGTTAEWFQKLSTTAPSMRILVFAQKASKSDSTSVLRRLVQALDVEIHHVIFTTCGNEGTSSVPSGGFRQCWTSSASFPSTTWLEPTHAQVMARVVSLSSTADNIHILVTGSLHLVGSILNHLKSEEPSG